MFSTFEFSKSFIFLENMIYCCFLKNSSHLHVIINFVLKYELKSPYISEHICTLGCSTTLLPTPVVRIQIERPQGCGQGPGQVRPHYCSGVTQNGPDGQTGRVGVTLPNLGGPSSDIVTTFVLLHGRHYFSFHIQFFFCAKLNNNNMMLHLSVINSFCNVEGFAECRQRHQHTTHDRKKFFCCVTF